MAKAAAKNRTARGAAHAAKKRTMSKERVDAIMRAAKRSGLIGEKSGRIGGRVYPALVRQAKRQTGIENDSDLIEFALVSIALEDNFVEAFIQSHGKVDPELKLGF